MNSNFFTAITEMKTSLSKFFVILYPVKPCQNITPFLRQPSILAYPNIFINTDFGNFNPPPHPTL